jgi:hypothetical protein
MADSPAQGKHATTQSDPERREHVVYNPFRKTIPPDRILLPFIRVMLELYQQNSGRSAMCADDGDACHQLPLSLGFSIIAPP